jgi:hypothetical protein
MYRFIRLIILLYFHIILIIIVFGSLLNDLLIYLLIFELNKGPDQMMDF